MEDSAEDLCYRCASIDWDHLEQEHKRFSSLWGGDQPLLGDLQTSSCRLCRLIASAILKHPVQHADTRSLVNITWHPSFGQTGHDCVGSITLWTRGTIFGELYLEPRDACGGDVTGWSTAAPKRVDFAEVRPGLEACKASHKSCEPAKLLQLHNLRVIDCIREAVVIAPIACSFVALSYVWGGLSADSYVLGSQITFPPTIEDAVNSTRELGYQYLWVDRYCINQEDPHDKKEQISQMGQIYATAQVTIAAAAGVDPTHGLEGISRDRTTFTAREPVGTSRYLCLFPEPAQTCIAHSPWFSRSWTLQEGYLSKRILCFTEREAVFICKSCDLTMKLDPNTQGIYGIQCQSSIESNIRTALSIHGNSLFDARNIMTTYSRRVRGHDSDALNAIIGILNVLRKGSSPVYHIWGVPFTITRRPDAAHITDSTMSISLNWHHPRSARRLPEFPSWSTLGWIGRTYDWGEPEVTPHFMIKYWSGERYQELDNGTCDLDYKYCRDVTHRSQYLEITTDVVQVKLHNWRPKDNISYFLQPTFIRRKEVNVQKEVWPNTEVQSSFLRLDLDDETTFDVALPFVCATMTPPENDSGSWRSFLDKHPLFLVFQQKAKSYERIGACFADVYTIDKKGEYGISDPSLWEFVPPGEPGAWDQVAERRTFLLG